MPIITILLMYVVLISLASLVMWAGVSAGWVIVFFAVAAIVLISIYGYIMTGSKNEKWIRRVIEFQKRSPEFGFLVAKKNGDEALERKHLEKLVKKTKAVEAREDYQFQLQLMDGNLHEAKAIVANMKNSPLKFFDMSYMDALFGRYGIARERQQKEQWLNHEIEAIIAYQQGNLDKYKQEMEIAISQAKGMHIYALEAKYAKGLRTFVEKKDKKRHKK